LNIYSNLSLIKHNQIWNINIFRINYLKTPSSSIMNWWVWNMAITAWISIKS
jgi:hypothetical protein